MADDSFSIHLDSLKEFAKEIDTQRKAFERPMEQLIILGQTNASLGDFREADDLLAHLSLVAGQVAKLGNKWQQAADFAYEVTLAVEDGYRRTDQAAAQALQNVAAGTPAVPDTPAMPGTIPVPGPAYIPPPGIVPGPPAAGSATVAGIVAPPGYAVQTSYPPTVYYATVTITPTPVYPAPQYPIA